MRKLLSELGDWGPDLLTVAGNVWNWAKLASLLLVVAAFAYSRIAKRRRWTGQAAGIAGWADQLVTEEADETRRHLAQIGMLLGLVCIVALFGVAVLLAMKVFQAYPISTTASMLLLLGVVVAAVRRWRLIRARGRGGIAARPATSVGEPPTG
jgi:hypothetical protein